MYTDVDGIYGRRIAYAQMPAPVNFAHFSDYCAKHLDEYIWQLRTRPSKSKCGPKTTAEL